MRKDDICSVETKKLNQQQILCFKACTVLFLHNTIRIDQFDQERQREGLVGQETSNSCEEKPSELHGKQETQMT